MESERVTDCSSNALSQVLKSHDRDSIDMLLAVYGPLA